MAGVSARDVDAVQLYDCYTITVVLSIEDSGFCAKGEGMGFVRDHDLTFAGDFPLNTHGGQLGFGQAGMAGGFSQVVEAVRQVRGRGRRPAGARVRHRLLLGHRRHHVRADGADRAGRLTWPAPRPPRSARPTPIDVTRPFWDGLAAGEVRLQRCRACDSWVFYPRPRCSPCLSDALDWHTVSGRGNALQLHRRPAGDPPGFRRRGAATAGHGGARRGRPPHLDDGRRGAGGPAVGLPVTPVFEPGDDGITLLRFRPAPPATP